jgi:hypothetical protein
MMTEKEIDNIVNDFILRFNEMCEKEKRSFLIRYETVNYEKGSKIKTINVTYRLKKYTNQWLIEAVSGGLCFLKKKFPLLRIIKDQNSIIFSGMFTSDFEPFDIQHLEEKLNEYLIICKNISGDVFTTS